MQYVMYTSLEILHAHGMDQPAFLCDCSLERWQEKIEGLHQSPELAAYKHL